MLSHHSLAVDGQGTCISRMRVCIHIISTVVFATDLYSTSILDIDTLFCFLALQDTRFVPRNIAYPPVDLLSSSGPAQSAFENPLTSSDRHYDILRPRRVVYFMYLIILLIVAQWTVVGECKN